MGKKRVPGERKAGNKQEVAEEQAVEHDEIPHDLAELQQRLGNRGVQRLLAQRSGDGSFELDDDTADRINQARGGGQSLDSSVQREMGKAMSHDFSGVKAHTSKEADSLSRQLRAKAFTTGKDIFFREGTYDPHSASGKKLLAHELSHVVQQGSGEVKGSGRMRVTAPGDSYEQEADALAEDVVSKLAENNLQRQEEEEEAAQMQVEEEEEEELMPQEEDEEAMQMQEEEEEAAQMQEEEEEAAQMQEEEEEMAQMQEEEEEMAQMQEEEEEMAQMQEEEEEAAQMQAEPEEEEEEAEVQTAIMRQGGGKGGGIGFPPMIRISAGEVGKSLMSLTKGVVWAQDAVRKVAKKIGMS
jgi:hypothetical protein